MTRDEELIKRTLEELTSLGVLKSDKVEVSRVSRHRFGYVIDDKNRSANVAKIHGYLTDNGILTCGRFAEFEYLNMDNVADYALAFLTKHRTKLAEAGWNLMQLRLPADFRASLHQPSGTTR
jgi:protoporphyrinogen oxidase